MYQQVIRELALLKEEEEEEKEEGAGEDVGHDDDGEENEDDQAVHHSKLMNSKFGRYSVPAEGYDEDEDCINVEDEEYLDLIKNNSMESKAQEFLAGEPVDDEEEDDMCNTDWVLKDTDARSYFFDTMRQRDTMFIQMLNSHLTQDDTNLLNHLAQFSSL